MMRKMLDLVTLLLVIVGALNWGLVGLFKFDLVATIVGKDFGQVSLISRLIYVVIAAAGGYQLMRIAQQATDEPSSVQ